MLRRRSLPLFALVSSLATAPVGCMTAAPEHSPAAVDAPADEREPPPPTVNEAPAPTPTASPEAALSTKDRAKAESMAGPQAQKLDMLFGDGASAASATASHDPSAVVQPKPAEPGLMADRRASLAGGGGIATHGIASGEARARVAEEKLSRRAPPMVARPMESSTAPRPDVDRDDAVSPGGGFAAVSVNPWTATATDAQSTFAVDVDSASYTFARRFLERGQRPPPGAVRVEEFVNAFHYDYAPPERDAFRVHVAAAPSPLGGGHHLVRVALKGREVSNAARKPVHLTFLVDTSGSMSAHDKLPLAKGALHTLTDNLRDDDSVALITYAGSTEVILEQTKVKHKKAIHEAIDRLRSGGGTNMGSGMELAYKNAHRYLSSDSESRVIVLSDGDANIGRTTHKSILDAVKGYVSEGVTLSTVGFGTGNYQDHTMEQLANAGNGNYSYIDSMKAANKVFGTDLAGTLQVIAKDVKIQVEWNPDAVKRYRLLGYENRDIADRDFRNDKVDAGEIGSGHAVTALYEVELTDKDPSRFTTLATVRVRAKTPKGIAAKETAMELTGAHVEDRYSDLDSDARFAMALALAGEVLRGSPHAEGFSLEDAFNLASEALDGPYVEERKELVELLGRAVPRAGVAVR